MGAYIGESYLRKLLVFYIPLFMFLAGMLFPFYWMLITSVKADSELYSAQSVPFLVSHVTADHWIYLFKDTLFLRWAWNTLFIATLSTALSLIAGTLAGYSLARLRFPGASTFGISIFVTYLVPFSTWLLMGYFATIPKELEECARIAGATRLQAMVKVVLPLGLPGLLSAGIFSFTLSWNEFLYALVFISSPDQKTIPVGVVSELIKGDVFFWGSLMDGAVVGA